MIEGQSTETGEFLMRAIRKEVEDYAKNVVAKSIEKEIPAIVARLVLEFQNQLSINDMKNETIITIRKGR